jgi:hypothetical protein
VAVSSGTSTRRKSPCVSPAELAGISTKSSSQRIRRAV